MHPYSNVAWKVLSSVYEVACRRLVLCTRSSQNQAAKKQEETDEKVVKLVQTMADVYSFAEDVESLSGKIIRFEKIISALVKQTEECALFIREYTGHGFCGRYIRNCTFVSPIKFTGRL